MTVKELIEKLQELPEDLEIYALHGKEGISSINADEIDTSKPDKVIYLD